MYIIPVPLPGRIAPARRQAVTCKMAYVDSDGLFGGDRFTLMSDEARLYWPYFWCASNSVGRIELNYFKVVAKAFYRFKKLPTEVKFWALMGEYREAYLLFCYEFNGVIWGQWDASEKFLPTYKLATDSRTPAPTVKEFLEWKSGYVQAKTAKSINANNFKKVLKTSGSFQTSGYGEDRKGEDRKGLEKEGEPGGSPSTKGTRLTLESIPEEWLKYPVEKFGWPPERTHVEFEKLQNWAKAASGSKAVKSDWFAAWKNWCRADEEKKPTRPTAQQPLYDSPYPNAPRYEKPEGTLDGEWR